MVAIGSSARVDERFVGAGTTIRFVLLLMLLIVASVSMVWDVTSSLTGAQSYGCFLAAGGDPNQDGGANAVLVGDQWALVRQCMARYQPLPPAWLPLVWTASVVVLAVGLFFALAQWKARRSRVVGLPSVDSDGELRRQLEDLVAAAGITGKPRFVVDPTAGSAGAVVFGRTNRAIVCLHGGLLARRNSEPHRFWAVVMHELGHVRNRDVTITYLTVALWRVFLVGVLLPYVAFYINTLLLKPMYWHGDIPAVARNLALAVFMVSLVYLARADVLRSREIYADLAAVRWGADPRGWVFPAAVPASSWVARGVGRFIELWRTHPRWEIRREALTDPSELFGVRGLPLFLAGAAVSLVNTTISPYFHDYVPHMPWTNQLVELIEGGMVAAVVGVALCRAVFFAVLTSRPAPSGLGAGLWLGAGLVASELVVNRITVTLWLPRQPVFLLLMVLASAVFAMWTTQCALLWARTWPGRTLQPVMLLALVPGCPALVSWFAWWDRSAAWFAGGSWFDNASLRHIEFSPVAGHSIELSLADKSWPYLLDLQFLRLGPVAVAMMWIVPLMAWCIRPQGASPRWGQAVYATTGIATPPDAESLPPLRSILRPAVLSGIAGICAVIATQAYMHSWQPLTSLQRHGDYELIYELWLLVSLALTAALAACAIGIRLRLYRMLAALIAAEIALLVAMVGVFALSSVDGCIHPLSTLAVSCRWRPALVKPLLDLLPAVIVGGALIALVTAVVAGQITDVRARQRPTRASLSRSRAESRQVRRRWVGVLCVAAIGITAIDGLWQAFYAHVHTAQQPVLPNTLRSAAAPIPPSTRAIQVTAWMKRGGEELMQRNIQFGHNMSNALKSMGEGVTGSRYIVLASCVELGRIADDASDYFRVPDPQTQLVWRRFIAQAQNGSRGCIRSIHDLDQQNNTSTPPGTDYPSYGFRNSISEIMAAEQTFTTALDRIGKLVDQ